MSIVFVNQTFRARHGEAIAGGHVLRSLNEVVDSLKVLSFDCPDAGGEFARRSATEWYFPRLPENPLANRGEAAMHWIGDFLRHDGWRRGVAPRNLGLDDCEGVVINGGASLNLSQQLRVVRRCPSLLIMHSPVRRLLHAPDSDSRVLAFQDRTRHIDAFAFVSRNVERDWLASGLVQGRATFFLSNCCDEEEVDRIRRLDRSKLRASLGLRDDQEIAICLASVQERKGQDLIVSEMPELLRRRPNLHVICLGRIDNGWGHDLVRRVAESSFSDRLHFLGEKTNALEYLHASDLLVVPSRSEAFPLVLLEAMALRVPIVASRVDGNSEAVVHGETGLLFESERSGPMADAMARLLETQDLRDRLVGNGHRRYWSTYSHEHQRLRVKDILDQLRLMNSSFRQSRGLVQGESGDREQADLASAGVYRSRSAGF